MSALLRLIYVSRSTRVVDARFLDALLEQSRSRNLLLSITGILCTGRGYFVQVLEGPEVNLLTLYARILTDTRHRQPSLIGIGLTAERAFSKWSMAHMEGDTLAADLHSELLAQALTGDSFEQAKLLQTAIAAMRKAET